MPDSDRSSRDRAGLPSAPPETLSPNLASELGAGARYDGTTILYHWVTAGCVALLWCIGQTIDDFAKGLPRMTARSAHIVLGVALGIILVARVLWRLRRGRRLPAASPGLAGRTATAAHRVLYVLLAVTVVVGVGNAWIRGDTIVGLFKIPSLAPGNQALREQVEDVHAWLANTLLIVAALHAAAALFHHFIRRDGVLRRMLGAAKAR